MMKGDDNFELQIKLILLPNVSPLQLNILESKQKEEANGIRNNYC